MTTEPPKGLRANLLRLYNTLTDEGYAQCKAATKYQKLVFALSYFHRCEGVCEGVGGGAVWGQRCSHCPTSTGVRVWVRVGGGGRRGDRGVLTVLLPQV